MEFLKEPDVPIDVTDDMAVRGFDRDVRAEGLGMGGEVGKDRLGLLVTFFRAVPRMVNPGGIVEGTRLASHGRIPGKCRGDFEILFKKGDSGRYDGRIGVDGVEIGPQHGDGNGSVRERLRDALCVIRGEFRVLQRLLEDELDEGKAGFLDRFGQFFRRPGSE